VDPRSEIREFLTSRRAKITPERAGLTSYGPRRVPGLRREEIAVLAGVSVPYYTRIERGELNGVSDSLLEALARALELDEAERAHLFDLARALYSDMFSRSAAPGPVNSARYVFLDPGARDFYIDWERAASDVVAILRSAAGRDPYDRELSDLVGELSTQSEEFRTRWAAHNVRFHDTGIKEFHHAVVGELTLTYNRMELSPDPGLAITIYTAEPATKSADPLSLLGSWAARSDQPEPAQQT
jgi:transcriptional regulator with XRE-family HTH domain